MGVVVGRLESTLFAVAWDRIAVEELHRQADTLRRALLGVGLPLDAGLPTLILAHRQGLPLTGPQVLSSALSTLESMMSGQRGTNVEADLESTGYLHKDEALLRTLQTKLCGRSVLLAAIQDEDYLRHQLGNRRLAGQRWKLRKAVMKTAEPDALVGVLDERIFVLQTDDIEETGQRIQRTFKELTPYPLQLASMTLPEHPPTSPD